MDNDCNENVPPGSGAICSASDLVCVVADPPWEIDTSARPDGTAGGSTLSRTPGIGWTNEKVRPLPYPSMTVEEIAALKVPAAPDAHLYIWTVNKYIEATYDIARAWGFEPSAMLTWIKQPMGLGLGGTFCSNTEFILFCRRGKLSAKRKVDTRWWGWPRGKHSEKPEAFQTLVESVSPGPYLEMFARRKRPGWHSWGNEVLGDVLLDA
jgi:N6-adenosine-specific RNA methylase IME4